VRRRRKKSKRLDDHGRAKALGYSLLYSNDLFSLRERFGERRVVFQSPRLDEIRVVLKSLPALKRGDS